MIRCMRCGFYCDRDKNAGVNVLAKGLGFSLAGPTSEAMVRDGRGRDSAAKTSVDAGHAIRSG